MGRVGYLYESAKDQIRWHHLEVKDYINLIMSIGQIMSYAEEDYKKEKVKALRMNKSEIADALIAAFGDGK